ncbi:hypothetical protein BO71DRAFT_443907 [Aspergillus ellipticus CBS 707.79]|uniref:Uncharacterized protein n=1 Tax=Aspergillus ellipticus CBS 707.79 TaxID=1448320 RepID=A0A319EHN4_9EURO|nr:hypothetical protein BO71DRAFT_443907 [Aspergillus ellipticus CBS 707.79]
MTATTTPPQTLTLTLPIPHRNPLTLTATVTRSTDPRRIGFHLLFPDDPIANFVGFPITHITLRSTPAFQGYASMYGWIQLTRERPPINPQAFNPEEKEEEEEEETKEKEKWTLDPLPITAGTDSPFAFFGVEPQLFDAPANPYAVDLDWTARSFLVRVEDCLMTRVLRPVVVLEWGYEVRDGERAVKLLRRLSRGVWDEHRGELGGWFPSWRFCASTEEEEEEEEEGVEGEGEGEQ